MGLDFAKAALAAGHNVVATGRNPDAVAQALGDSDDLLVVKLDVTSAQDAETATTAPLDRFDLARGADDGDAAHQREGPRKAGAPHGRLGGNCVSCSASGLVRVARPLAPLDGGRPATEELE